MEEILQIIYSRSFEEKIISIDDLAQIIDYVINNRGVLSSINRILINTDNKKKLDHALYDSYSRLLQFNYYSILDSVYKKGYDTNVKYTLSSYEKTLLANFYFLFIVFHEIEHVWQTIKSKDSTLESRLVDIERFYYLSQFHELQDNFLENGIKKNLSIIITTTSNKYNLYKVSIMERLASLNALNTITSFPYDNQTVYSYLYATLVYYRLKGYEKKKNEIICPSIKFFSKLGKINELPFEGTTIEDKVHNILASESYDERIHLGLPITIEEFTQTQDVYKRVKKN